jgi:antitoxin (DNA-binding transcriptional repressor) of toxin-antitoxin stability system
MSVMTTIVSVSDARANLPGLVDRVQAGEEVTLTATVCRSLYW